MPKKQALERWLRLKRQVESFQREADRADGALNQLLIRLKKQFGVDSIEGAKRLLDKLKWEEQQSETDFNKALKNFERKWKDRL